MCRRLHSRGAHRAHAPSLSLSPWRLPAPPQCWERLRAHFGTRGPVFPSWLKTDRPCDSRQVTYLSFWVSLSFNFLICRNRDLVGLFWKLHKLTYMKHLDQVLARSKHYESICCCYHHSPCRHHHLSYYVPSSAEYQSIRKPREMRVSCSPSFGGDKAWYTNRIDVYSVKINLKLVICIFVILNFLENYY